MPDIGPLELILLLAIALLILGPGKLPDVGKAVGQSIREFRKATTDVQDAVRLDPAPPAPTGAPAPAAPAPSATPTVANAVPAAAPAAIVAPPPVGPVAPPAPGDPAATAPGTGSDPARP